MWTYRLIIGSRDEDDTRLYGSECDLLDLRETLEARREDGAEETVTWHGSGAPVVIRVASVATLSDVDPVVVPDDLALSLG